MPKIERDGHTVYVLPPDSRALIADLDQVFPPVTLTTDQEVVSRLTDEGERLILAYKAGARSVVAFLERELERGTESGDGR